MECSFCILTPWSTQILFLYFLVFYASLCFNIINVQSVWMLQKKTIMHYCWNWKCKAVFSKIIEVLVTNFLEGRELTLFFLQVVTFNLLYCLMFQDGFFFFNWSQGVFVSCCHFPFFLPPPPPPKVVFKYIKIFDDNSALVFQCRIVGWMLPGFSSAVEKVTSVCVYNIWRQWKLVVMILNGLVFLTAQVLKKREIKETPTLYCSLCLPLKILIQLFCVKIIEFLCVLLTATVF